MKKLVWDSDFFEHDVYKSRYVKGRKLLFLSGLTYLFSNEQVIELKQHLQDVKITYKKDINSLSNIAIDKEVVSYEFNNVTDELRLLALKSGSYSRFNLDKKISKEIFISLYSLWIENSVSKKIADEILIVYKNEIVVGFVSFKKINKTCKIGLIAVCEKHRGFGIGKKLLNGVVLWAIKKKCTSVVVETQLANNLANKFYCSSGFVETNREFIYHIWK